MEAQIAKMRELYDAVPEKPEWLTVEDIDRYEARMKAGTVTVAVPNYEATVTAEEAPLLSRLLENSMIDTVRFVHDNGDVTFSFAASDADTVEQLVAKLRAELSKAALATEQETAPQKPGRTRPELNYRAFAKMFPEIATGKYRYLQMKGGEGLMPLHLEWIGTDVIAVSHTYELNGDLMYDPEMTFRVDREKGALEPLTFRQDGSISLYQEVYPEPGKWIPKLSRDLSNFAQQWFSNISQQNYHKIEAIMERDGEDVRLTFDQDGKALEPTPDVPSEPDVKSEQVEDSSETPPSENPIPESTGAGASDATEKPDTAVWRTPGGIEYRTGNVADYDFGGDSRGTIIISDIDEDYIYYIFPDFEQQPVSMLRDEFEKDLDNGGFTIADPAHTVEINNLPTKADRVDYTPVDAGEPELTPNVEQYLNLKAQYRFRL